MKHNTGNSSSLGVLLPRFTLKMGLTNGVNKQERGREGFGSSSLGGLKVGVFGQIFNTNFPIK